MNHSGSPVAKKGSRNKGKSCNGLFHRGIRSKQEKPTTRDKAQTHNIFSLPAHLVFVQNVVEETTIEGSDHTWIPLDTA